MRQIRNRVIHCGATLRNKTTTIAPVSATTWAAICGVHILYTCHTQYGLSTRQSVASIAFRGHKLIRCWNPLARSHTGRNPQPLEPWWKGSLHNPQTVHEKPRPIWRQSSSPLFNLNATS